ncbi:hypothetical protein BABINDRAFT_122289 [Babjeviella inositovora NRRL Y-12698]|uniref:Uncharacterized protein n=1 Tax=Babjeviella inositovora NRRL Y-12698 TaxID=984486 RepID=A0A1E3QUP7_9ASCO|nr:uncharacterized protein BABINDRAFT_122289 [Babjeviella inositovora NRRL Y-12698]ODQ81284.1 hypothetical protein BABINDRAFT_122289 [Babjeviella inositovora NRRL Y-12698]
MANASKPQTKPESMSQKLWDSMGQRFEHLSPEEALAIAEKASAEAANEEKEPTEQDEAWFEEHRDILAVHAKNMADQNTWFQAELTKITARHTMLVADLKKHTVETERLKALTEQSILNLIDPKPNGSPEKILEQQIPGMLGNLSEFRQSLKESLED